MWIAKQFQRLNPCSSDLEADDSIYPYACYACTQVGVPVFHSTTCDPDHQPEWEASAGSSLLPINCRKSRTGDNPSPPGLLPGRVLDPRSARVQRWNRIILLARAVALAVDPLFFFAMSIRVRGGGGAADNQPCVYRDGGVATIVSAIRTCVDLVHTCHFWLQFRLAYVSKASLVVGCGKLVWDPRAIASRYLMSPAGFWLDVFVVLPIPQIFNSYENPKLRINMFLTLCNLLYLPWLLPNLISVPPAVYLLVVPKLLEADRIQLTLSMLPIIFLMQFLPKVYHSFSLMRRMRKVTGYIFGTIWWGFGLNLIAYFLASHVSGGYCQFSKYRTGISLLYNALHLALHNSVTGVRPPAIKNCLVQWRSVIGHLEVHVLSVTQQQLINHCAWMMPDPFIMGLYKFALPLFSKNSAMTKILYSNLWGLMALRLKLIFGLLLYSTMGNNLEPTCRCLEVIFTIFMVLGGLMLFTLLIANIQVFLHAIMVRRKEMQLRYRGIEWWMRHRQLPSNLKCRVRRYENQRWKLAGGQDEMEFIRDLPEGLRRDIKHYLCLGLIKKVPLLCSLDDLILDNICDRVKPLVCSKDEKIIREGDPVQRMIFIVDGRIRRSQSLGEGVVADSMLEAGSFLGDELLSWCLRRPVADRLPASPATFTCIEPAEAYALDADDFRYITNHFRFHFASKSLKQTARYYSSNWRTWAAVNIQIAWRHYKTRARGSTNQLMLENGGSDIQRRLRHCAAFFMSLRPHDHPGLME